MFWLRYVSRTVNVFPFLWWCLKSWLLWDLNRAIGADFQPLLCAALCNLHTLVAVSHGSSFPPIAAKQKVQSKASSRKSKSPNPGQAYTGGERPSSVSSVHSEGEYHRQAPSWAWEDRPSSAGEFWEELYRSSLTDSCEQFDLTNCVSVLSRSNAVPLQPSDYAHVEQHASHLHGLPISLHAVPATTRRWSQCSGPRLGEGATSALGAVRNPVGQRRLSWAVNLDPFVLPSIPFPGPSGHRESCPWRGGPANTRPTQC